MAQVLAERAACVKRQVGCVVVDDLGQVVGTGYNGRARHCGNCLDLEVCIGGCEGVHAEVNALLQAGQRGRVMHLTHAPCWHCMKTIVNSGIRMVYYLDATTLEDRSALLACDAGVHLRQTTV